VDLIDSVGLFRVLNFLPTISFIYLCLSSMSHTSSSLMISVIMWATPFCPCSFDTKITQTQYSVDTPRFLAQNLNLIRYLHFSLTVNKFEKSNIVMNTKTTYKDKEEKIEKDFSRLLDRYNRSKQVID